ncbi:MAG: ribosome silencing factor [Peptococcaceae bacterium]|nr:ribosome silencing factor [Peptococcaceae bacterium]
MTISPRALAELVRRVAGKKKARDITVLDISKISIIADFFVICSGSSSVNVQAIAGEIVDRVREEFGGLTPRVEGYREGRWVLLDYGDVVIHVFQEEERRFYNLERLWGDAPVVAVSASL